MLVILVRLRNEIVLMKLNDLFDARLSRWILASFFVSKMWEAISQLRVPIW